jgi:hypothetical protein
VLWHFDDATARWKENGTATKTGSNYIAQVDKFSFWNCDVGRDFINLSYTLLNLSNNNPLVSTSTRIKRISNGNYGFGVTNNIGFVYGSVPKNELLILEVVSNCNTVIYSQNIGPFVTNTDLGNINASFPSSQSISFTGNLLNYSGGGVTNGYISFFAAGGIGNVINTGSNGVFSFSILNCTGNSLSYNYQGSDNLTSLQSAILFGASVNGVINLGNINACGNVGNTVYAVGYEKNGLNNNNIAKIWRNGIVSNLTNGMFDAVPYAIFVSGFDVYAVGRESNGINHIAKVWKNGIASNLTDGNNFAQATSIFVSGTDVYVTGYEYNASGYQVAKVWKNGIASNLTDGTKNANTHSIVVSGSDVYVAGEEAASIAGNYVAKVWKNGVATSLTSGTNNSTFGNSIKLVGTDVYVAGREYISISINRAISWKNGVLTNLTNGLKDASVNSIDVSGTDIYLTGYENDNLSISTAKFWKNGIATNLTNGINSATTSSILIKGTDIYVGGGEKNGTNNVAKIWKNGLQTILSDGTNNAFVMAISVN